MAYVLGVDVGGSKTEALVADDGGRALGYGRSGAGNHQAVGYDGMRDAIGTALERALANAGLAIAHIDAAGFGIAGYDWPSQHEVHLHEIAPLGLPFPVEIVNDSIVALLAGAPEGWGVVMIAGTGNNCRGRSRDGLEARITGEGARFGEHGGGGSMVHRAIHAIAHAWTRRGPATRLIDTFIDLAGARDVQDLIEGIDLGRYRPASVWAEAIFRTAEAGDAVAAAIIEWAARELGESACGVIRQLGLEREQFDAVLAGGVMSGGERFTGPLKELVRDTALGANFLTLAAPPAMGGVVLALRTLGGFSATEHEVLTESAVELLRDRQD